MILRRQLTETKQNGGNAKHALPYCSARTYVLPFLYKSFCHGKLIQITSMISRATLSPLLTTYLGYDFGRVKQSFLSFDSSDDKCFSLLSPRIRK